MTTAPLPDAWVERVFERFARAWGVQKVGALLAPDTRDATVAAWAERLAGCDAETLRNAIQTATSSDADWPPTLDEFADYCGRRRTDPVPPPPPPPAVVEREIAGVAQAATTRRGGLAWAERILARHQAGEKLSITVLRMAQAALGFRHESESV